MQIHIGVQNLANAVADSALIEFGVWPFGDGAARKKISRGEFPDGIVPARFLPDGIRNITWVDDSMELSRKGLPVAWSRMVWHDSNPALAERYGPIFRTEVAWPVGVLNLRGVNVSNGRPELFALCFWRIQAHNMQPREGVLRVDLLGDPSGIPSILCIRTKETKLEVD